MQPTLLNLKVQCFKYMEKHAFEHGTPDDIEMYGIAENFLTETFNVAQMAQIIAANWEEVVMLNNDMLFGFWISGNRIGIGRDIDKKRGVFGLIEILIADEIGKWMIKELEHILENEQDHLVLDEDPDGEVPSVEMWHWTEIADRAAKSFIDGGKHLSLYNPDTPHKVWNKEIIPVAHDVITEDYPMEECVHSVLTGWHDFRKTQSMPGAMDGTFVDRIPHLVHRLIVVQADFQDIGEERANGLPTMIELALSKSLVVETRNRIYELLEESYANGNVFKAMVKDDNDNWATEEVVGKYAYSPKEK